LKRSADRPVPHDCRIPGAIGIAEEVRDRMVVHRGCTRGLAFAAFIGALMGQADAQEFCVACTEPTAVYRCVIEGARPGGGQPLQVLCVTTMAREGKHATCGIKRGTVFDCDGPVKRVPWSAAELPVEAPGTATAADKPEPDPNEPPRTIVEMVKRANEQKASDAARNPPKSPGEAIGDATKKSWDCLTSLFKEC
jgi:hypothetical protein